MAIPKPKSPPGLLLYGISTLAFILLGNIILIVVGQNVEAVSTDKGYDKLLSRHWVEIMAWLGSNYFWLSLITMLALGIAIGGWLYLLALDVGSKVGIIAAPSEGPLDPLTAEIKPGQGGKAMSSSYKNEELYPWELIQAGDVFIRNKLFEECIIYGPAVLSFQGQGSFSHCRFAIDDVNRMMIEVEPQYIMGIYVFDNCIFHKCTFANLAVIGLKQELEPFRKMAVGRPS